MRPMRKIAAAILASVAFAATMHAAVTIQALEGQWISDSYATTLSFKWLPVLDPSEACIDYITLDRPGTKPDAEDRMGYAWKGGKLELYRIIINDESGCPITAEKTPFAVLSPRASSAAAGGHP
jgi:hypothetical protein